jgi:hypothetical protein
MTPPQPFRPFVLLALTAVFLGFLPGCFIIVEDDDDDDTFSNELPFLFEDEDSTYWNCGPDDITGDQAYEFQTVVGDPDGLSDIDEVIAFVYDADSDAQLDAFDLFDEGDGVYGGFVWEDETTLFCGEPIDVTFQVWDVHGDSASFTLYY